MVVTRDSRVPSFSGKVGPLQVHTLSMLGFKIGSGLLNLALAGLMDESRVEFELHFEVIVGAAEECKTSEKYDELEMDNVTATQQQSA